VTAQCEPLAETFLAERQARRAALQAPSFAALKSMAYSGESTASLSFVPILYVGGVVAAAAVLGMLQESLWLGCAAILQLIY